MLFLLLSFAIAGVVYYFFYHSDFFKIDSIRIEGAKSFVNQTDLEEVVMGNTFGHSIFMLDSQELKKILQETFQGSKEIRVFKIYPKTVGVEVFERVPLALVHNSNSSEVYMVDMDGYVLGIVDEERTNLPRIKYEGDIKVGHFVDQKLVPVFMELVGALNDNRVNASSVSFFPNYATLYVSEGVEVLVSNDKSKTDSIRILNDLLKQTETEGKRIKKVDLRYNKVIVSYDE